MPGPIGKGTKKSKARPANDDSEGTASPPAPFTGEDPMRRSTIIKLPNYVVVCFDNPPPPEGQTGSARLLIDRDNRWGWFVYEEALKVIEKKNVPRLLLPGRDWREWAHREEITIFERDIKPEEDR